MRFDELQLSDDILDALDAMNFEECTPIQEKSIDLILNGNDLIACAQTGTGKTAAYLLPIIDLLAETEATPTVKCVIMVPTHELAKQIDQQMEGFAYYMPVSSLAIHGGNDGKEFARQQHALRQGADMVIATPGRLLAHMKMGYVDLSHVRYFVLDEADRMLDMGFSDDIMRIVAELPKDRQTLMFSATMPKKIQQLAATILHEPKEVKIAVSKPAEKIDQSIFVCHEGQKAELLKRLFADGFNKRVIVFSSSKQKVKELTQLMRRAKWKAAEMHSDLDQKQREDVMLDFRAGRIDILIATDILARGIDIDDIAMVVNYDVPREAEDYVHRIGRTARANTDGKAVTFVSERDQQRWAQIESFLGTEIRRPRRRDSGKGGHRGGKGSRRGSGDKQRNRSKKPNSQAAEATAPQAPAPKSNAEQKQKKRYYRRRPKQKKAE